MAAPTVSSASPADGESNVYLNKRLTVVFSEAIDSTTINDNTVRLIHAPTSAATLCTLNLSTDGLTLTITPSRSLEAEESYTLTLIGESLGLAFYVKSGTGHSLAVSVSITFTTGNDVEAYTAEKTDLTSEREGDLRLPADIQVVSARRLEVLATTPTHHSAGLSLSLSSIQITFSAELSGELYAADWMSVDVYPLMSYDDYLAIDDDGTMVWNIDDPDDIDFGFPTGTITATGEYLIWTRTEGETFPYNCEVEVTLGKDIQDKWGNKLLRDKKLVFAMSAFPMYSGVRAVEKELPGLPEEVDRDLIHALIWKNSILAWQTAGSTDPAAKSFKYYRQFAHAATCLDILENAEIPKSVLAGQKKSLGDFFVGYEANAIGVESLKYKRLKKLLEEATAALTARRRMRVSIRGSNTDRPNWRHRTWRNGSAYNTSRNPGAPVTSNSPVANDNTSRRSELPGEYDGWS